MTNFYSIEEVKQKVIQILNSFEVKSIAQYNNEDFQTLQVVENFLSEMLDTPCELKFITIAELIKDVKTYESRDDDPDINFSDAVTESKKKLTLLATQYIQENSINAYTPEELVNYWLIKGSM